MIGFLQVFKDHYHILFFLLQNKFIQMHSSMLHSMINLRMGYSAQVTV